MALTVNRVRNEKLFQQVMGKGGMIMTAPSPEPQGYQKQDHSHLVPDTPEGIRQAMKMIGREAREQMSGETPPENRNE